jgi:uncharacterized membrane protein YkvA (DUF1232 family)
LLKFSKNRILFSYIIEQRKIKKMARLEAKRRMKNLLMFLPNMVALCGRLLMDGRVPVTEKALFAGAIIYALMPLDFIPDMLPFVGQVDDAYLISLTLLRLIGLTDDRVVREHWRGGGDVVELVGSTAMLAGKLLPKRIRRVLTSQLEAPKTSREQSDTTRTPLLIERPVAESTPVQSN